MLTITVVLAAWVVLSLPVGLLVGSLFRRQGECAPPPLDAPTQRSAPRVPVQAGSAA